jgi:cytochrome c-type biogenesis protein CcmH
MDRPQDAARAYDAALRRDPNAADAMIGMGKAFVAIDEGRVGPDALRLFTAAAEAAPTDPRPWIYQAMAAMQQGDHGAAQRAWGEAGKRMAPDDPRRAMAERFGRGDMSQP